MSDSNAEVLISAESPRRQSAQRDLPLIELCEREDVPDRVDRAAVIALIERCAEDLRLALGEEPSVKWVDQPVRNWLLALSRKIEKL